MFEHALKVAQNAKNPMSKSNKKKQQHPLAETIGKWDEQSSPDEQERHSVESELDSIAVSCAEADQFELAELSNIFSGLIKLAGYCQTDDTQSELDGQSMLGFVKSHLDCLLDHIEGTKDEPQAIAEVIGQAQSQWGDSLELVSDQFSSQEEDGAEPAVESSDFEPEPESPSGEPATEQIDLMLSVLEQQTAVSTPENPATPDTSAAAEQIAQTDDSAEQADRNHFEPRSAGSGAPASPASLSVSKELQEDVGLRDAYLDDANRCLASMEHVALDDSSDHQQRIILFCRELHTLKGASASVGLGELAAYLHELEEWLGEIHQKTPESIDEENLLSAIDSVRKQVGLVQPKDSQPNQANDASSSSQQSPLGTSLSGDSSVRVRASQLDKLMDMLAELVVIRNRRETQVNDLNQVNEEIGRCFSRLRQFNDRQFEVARSMPNGKSARTRNGNGSLALGFEPTSSNAIAEVSRDLAEISRSLAEVYKPIAEENQALSHFIRQFRQELMQLRRLPVSGLFGRLNRAARDAARAENKKIQLKFEGEDTGLEQSVQEKLFEPLLHMVRNSVSHGIEDAEVRSRNGKSEVGTVTLRAGATASLLAITVSDDGRGLDYAALRRRGFERGLLAQNRRPSRQELAKLIFHPGFSTRDEASEVSGRGIGMDVVATTIDRLHGRIEVDSQTGSGTTIRVLIPLTTGIEHAMVFRSAGKLFALPMRSIAGAAKGLHEQPDKQLASFASLMGLGNGIARSTQQTLMLDGQLGFRVDEVLGPEEVVVRALPALLQRHPMFAGVVLSGSGETVLLLNADRMAQLCQTNADPSETDPHETDLPAVAVKSDRAASVLIVDDSLSARRSLAKRLRGRGFEVVEANDGLDALGYLQSDQFEAVFTDLDMPRMGGLELLSEINQNESIKASVIVVSSRCQDDVWQRASENGAKAYLNKPVSEDSLAETLDQLNLAKS